MAIDAAPGALASGLVVNPTGSGGSKPLVTSRSAEEVRRNRLSLDKATMKNAKTASRSAEDVRRNRLNMEKMIMKNVKASSRPSTKNRAQQIMELALKKKRQQQGDEEGADDVERGAKRKKTSPPHGDADARAAVIAGILSPGRRPTSSSAMSASAATFASPTRGYHPHQRSPIMALSSPARARTMFGSAPLHLASPVRPPRSSRMASPKCPTRSGNVASPLRRNEFLTSPLRHRASASPKRPLVFEESSSAASADVAAPPSLINGHPPLLSSVLDQIEVAPAAKAAKVARSSKSPFQSFQAKFNKSPARVGQPITTSSSSSQQRESGSAPSSTRSGPMMVDLSHSDGATTPSPAAISASTAVPPPSASVSNGVSEPSAPTSTIAPISSTSDSLALVVTPPPKPARKLFQARPVVAQKSLCFSTEGVATSVDVTPDGEIVVVGFTDGSVRLYEMDSSVPSDRHGYLLGHIDERSSRDLATVHLRVKISPDGRYVFVGCRQGPRVVMSINLHHYRNEKGSFVVAPLLYLVAAANGVMEKLTIVLGLIVLYAACRRRR
ncbi:hypothetical protein BBJ28_00015379 [Nothophytophthora sp. Chile5]|nr:hypothetical protein BBJ28_00015379 [Nothophytophthora sp. Chile5]